MSVPARSAADANGMLIWAARLRGESSPRCTKHACGTQETPVTCLGSGLGPRLEFGRGQEVARVRRAAGHVEPRHSIGPNLVETNLAREPSEFLRRNELRVEHVEQLLHLRQPRRAPAQQDDEERPRWEHRKHLDGCRRTPLVHHERHALSSRAAEARRKTAGFGSNAWR